MAINKCQLSFSFTNYWNKNQSKPTRIKSVNFDRIWLSINANYLLVSLIIEIKIKVSQQG